MMTAVVKEFGCTTGRSEKGLSLEFLVDCKKTIEVRPTSLMLKPS